MIACDSVNIRKKKEFVVVVEVGFCFEEELVYETLMKTFEQTLEFFPPVVARLEKKGLNCGNQGCILEVMWADEFPCIRDIFPKELFLPIHKEVIVKSGGPLAHFRITYSSDRNL